MLQSNTNTETSGSVLSTTNWQAGWASACLIPRRSGSRRLFDRTKPILFRAERRPLQRVLVDLSEPKTTQSTGGMLHSQGRLLSFSEAELRHQQIILAIHRRFSQDHQATTFNISPDLTARGESSDSAFRKDFSRPSSTAETRPVVIERSVADLAPYRQIGTESTNAGFVVLRMSTTKRRNALPASDFRCKTRPAETRQVVVDFSMIYNAPLADWVGFGFRQVDEHQLQRAPLRAGDSGISL